MINKIEKQMLEQKVVNNPEIFEAISDHLQKARKEIVVVSAWFTDTDLLEILIEKQRSGVNVVIMVAENSDTRKTDFSDLKRAGGRVVLIKGKGYGMMHQKFCIIDSRVAIHGSYNWTFNARKNNQESVIVTNHSDTIKELKKVYSQIVDMNTPNTNGNRNPISNLYNKLIPAKSDRGISSEIKAVKEANEEKNAVREFEFILEELIEHEVFKFNKDATLEDGFNRGKQTNGDHQTLPNILDTLYADFVNSLDIAKEKKESLKARIQELKNAKVNKLKLERDQEVHVEESDFKARENQLEQELSRHGEKIALQEAEEKNIRENEIAYLNKENKKSEEEIENLQVEFTKSRLKWYELGPAIAMGIILLAYLVVFYSSAAYILIYSEMDAKVAQMNGIPVEPAEVFDAMAISKALDKGGTAPVFMLLFVMIPIGLALLKLFIKKINTAGQIAIWTGIIVVDALLAYVVAKSIHEIDYLSGKIDETWQFSNFYSNENFFLVFVMGALGLVIFKVIYEKIHRSFEERNQDATRAKNQVFIEHLKKRMDKNEKIKKGFEDKISEIRKEKITLESENSKLSKEKEELPVSFERKKQYVFQKFNIKISEIEDVVSIYQIKLDNNDLKFSVNALKDRVNTFLGGWVNYLHDTYSIHKATQMSQEATDAKNQWLDMKIQNKVTANMN